MSLEELIRQVQALGPQEKEALKKACFEQQTQLHPLRSNCPCGGELGLIRPKAGQACIYCVDCNKWQYNVPKKELEQ